MDPTPRISPSDFQAQQEASGGLAGAYSTPLQGRVDFDMVADLAAINAGTSKQISWYNFTPATPPDPSQAAVLSPLTSFTVVLEGASADQAEALYDTCAEISLFNRDERTEALARAWLWTSDGGSALANVAPAMARFQVVLSYEGPPIVPVFMLRSGMIDGVSDPAQAIYWSFYLYPQARPGHAQARITIPSPCCVPPFNIDGSYLFKDHATANVPGTQNLPFPRQFRSKAISLAAGEYDMNIFGGPWKVQANAFGDGGGALIEAQMFRRSNQILGVTYGTPAVVQQTAADTSLESEVLLDGAWVNTIAAGAHYQEILCTHP